MKNNKYLPSIDSLRAIAVMSVIIYHCNSKYLSGGFLGVDLFFVLSGYLIGSLILKEYKENNTINLSNFYIRRARRLLPAVYTTITVALIIMVLFNKYLLNKSYLDAVFGYVYSSNWWYIFHNLDYFDTFGSQSPFKHLWSLAIEEQFYLFFPLLFLLLKKLQVKFNNPKLLNYSIIFLIVLSLFLHIYLFDFNEINRVYYGTDTRMFELLVGVLGAIYFPIDNLSVKVNKRTNMIYSITSLISIFIMIILMFYLSEYSKFLYYGGFLLLSFLFLIIIITTGQQTTIISKIMSFKPLVYIGKISYSLYLWHFPVLVFTTPSSELGNPSLLLNLFRIVLIFILAYFSFVLIEMPIRKYGFINFITNYYKKFISLEKNKKIIFGVIKVVIILLFIMGIRGKSIPYISTAFVSEENINKISEFKTDVSSKTDENNEQSANNENKVYSNLLVIGDSLSIDIANELNVKYPGVVIDGKVSRQVSKSVDVVKQYSNFNNDKTAVVFILGTNGLFTEEQLTELLKPMDKADIYFVNTRVPRVWEKIVNETLEENKNKYNNFTLIDWYNYSANHSEYFYKDGVHLTKLGIDNLVSLISNSFKYPINTNEMIEIEKKRQEELQKEEQKKSENNNNNNS